MWEADAKTIEGDFSSGSGTLRQVECTMIEKGKTALSAQANTALYKPKEKAVILQGKVTAQWPAKSTRMSADTVEWLMENKVVIARGNVVIENDQERIEGGFLRADTGLKKIRMTNGD